MALVGGGGVGFGHTVNPAGTGGGLNYIGKHAYAYSGTVDVDQNETTMLNFATSNAYIVAEFNLSSDNAAGDDFDFRIKMNGEDIMFSQLTAPYDVSEHMMNPLKLLIPPSTNVVITLQNVTQSATKQWNITMVGEVYA